MSSTSPWQHWRFTLENYRYPVNLSEYTDRQANKGWFGKTLKTGNRAETIQFETTFKARAPHDIAAWYEVVFWKCYGNKQSIEFAKVMIDTFRRKGVSAPDLWEACSEFIDEPSERCFRAIQRLFVFGRHLEECATFPAFIAPDRFPMVDRHIASWVSKHHEEQNMLDHDEMILVQPMHFDPTKHRALTIADYELYEQWIRWCQLKSRQLTELSGFPWRARDVEMAVSTAQRMDRAILWNRSDGER
jgi:hypothetical protein